MWVAPPSVCTPSQVRERAAGGPSRDVTLDSANVRSRTDPRARSDRPLMAGTARSQSTPIAVADQPSDRCRRTAAGLGLELSVPATSGSCATEPIADIECCLPLRGVGCGCAAVLAHQARRAMFAEPRDARSNDPPAAGVHVPLSITGVQPACASCSSRGWGWASGGSGKTRSKKSRVSGVMFRRSGCKRSASATSTLA